MVGSHPRSANACETCRRRKVKCSGGQPCSACVKHRWECIFRRPGRKRYSEAHINYLMNKIQSYEEQLGVPHSEDLLAAEEASRRQNDAPSISPVPPDYNPIDSTPEPHQPSPNAEANNSPQTLNYPGSDADISPGKQWTTPPFIVPGLPISVTTAEDLTSGPAFESQVRSLLSTSNKTGTSNKEKHGLVPNRGNRGSIDALMNHPNPPSLPSLEESQHLLDQFLFYLGVSQYFFDSRTFSDSMMLLFQSPSARQKQETTQFYTQYLLVMAMAKLMDVRQPTSEPPGSDLFAEAIKLLPPVHEFMRGGIIMVEILALITTYLQWCDQKEDAYFHIGLAIRLAIALGCHLPESEQTCLLSEATHRLRLWWTVYMLDRRLSSSLGLAAGADERQLRVEFPRHAVGFQSPVAMIINIRIARVTDKIMSGLYGNNNTTQNELVGTIQGIIQELHDIGRSFPQSLILDFSRPLQTVSRTGSSLYLMLLQAIILCTRPMLLRKVRLASQSQYPPQSTDSNPDPLDRLCETCNGAATRCLAILYALRLQAIILLELIYVFEARYGFFDLDATFSAAFALVMVGFTDATQKEPPPALIQAFEVLRFLARSGNLAAEQRFQDIARSCSHVWPNYTFDLNESEGAAGEMDLPLITRGQANSEGQPQDDGSVSNQPYSAPSYATVGGQPLFPNEMAFFENWNSAAVFDGPFDVGDLDIDFTDDAEGIYSSFHNSTLPLTGADYTDWLEIEKVLDAPAA